MKALSIKQPWAHLIASGIKDIENRTWRTNFRGKIYIHTSAKIVDVDFTREQTADLYINNIWLPGCGFPKEMRVVSAIIGEVEIIDCVKGHKSVWAEKSRDGEKPIWNWVLSNPVLYDRPILNVKGKLSFWEFRDLIECRCCTDKETDSEIQICERCEQEYCENCQAGFNQFSQIDYNCCTDCEQRNDDY